MSYVRNPYRFDLNKEMKNKVDNSEVNNAISRLEDILKRTRYYNSKVKKKVQKQVDFIVYLLDHPKRTDFSVDAKIDRVCKILQKVKDINLEELEDLRTYEIV